MFFSGAVWFLYIIFFSGKISSLVTVLLMFFLLFIVSFNISEFSFFSGIFFIDNMSFMMIMLSVYVVIMMEMSSYWAGSWRMSLLSVMLMLSLMCCFLGDSLFVMYLFFEGSLIPLLILMLMYGPGPDRFLAAVYLLLFTLMGSFLFLIQLIWFKVNFSLFLSLYSLVFMYNGLIWWLMMMMFLIKVPMYGVHFWLPKAHVEAPVTGSMILAGVMLKLGGYGALRLFNFITVKDCMFFQTIVISVGLLGGLMISFCCLRQIDIKILVAYSSVSHLSLVLGGIFSLIYTGSCGSIMMMIAHGLCSSGLFYIANLFYQWWGTRNMVMMKGSSMIFFSIVYWWVLFSLINMGVPMSMNFFSEIVLIVSLMKFSMVSIFVIGVMLVLSVAYSLILVVRLYCGSVWLCSVGSVEKMIEFIVVFMHIYFLLAYIFYSDVFLVWFSLLFD